MALEDIVFPELYKGYKRFKESVKVLEGVKTDPYNPSTPGDLFSYLVKYEGISQRDAGSAVEDVKGNPAKIRDYIERRAIGNQNELVRRASENYEPILNELPEDKLKGLAIAMPDKDKKYNKIIEYAQKGDMASIRKTLADVYESPIWKDFVMGGSEEFIKRQLTFYIQDAQSEFVNKKLSNKIEEEKDGKKKVNYVLNSRKMRDYLVDGIKDLEDNEDLEGEQIREMRNPLYFQAAEAYYKNEKKKIDDEEEDETDEERQREMAKPENHLFIPVGEQKAA